MSKLERKQIVLVACYLALVATLLYLLFEARTPIARTIWATFDPSNLVVYLAMTFVLLVIVMFKRSPQITLSLIIVQSIVVRVFKQIVFASRFGYDTWISLGWSTYIFRSESYPAPFMVYGQFTSLLSRIYHVTERVNLYSLSVLLARMFSVDVYWTHLLLVSLLWGIFVPILIYRISKFLCKGETVPLLAALLSSCVPSLISWGSTTLSFGLAWIFLLLVFYLSLSYLRFRRGLLLLVIIAFVAFLTHELMGMLSVSIILLTYTYKVISHIKGKRFRRTSLLMVFIITVLLVPSALVAFSLFINPKSGARFSLSQISPITYETLFTLIFGGFTDMMFIDVVVSGTVTFLGIISLVYLILQGKWERQSRRMNIFMFLCLALIMTDYRILKFFMINLPLSVERLPAWRDLLIVPYAAIAIGITLDVLKGKLASGKVALEASFLRKNPVEGVVSRDRREVIALLILVLSLSSLSTSVVYQAYPQYTEAWWTTAYELEAAKYIEENTPRNETYAVLSDALGRLAGYAVVGPRNPRAYWYGPYESKILKPLYSEMVTNPSLGPVLAVRDKNHASIVFVVLTRSRTKDVDRVVAQMMDLPYSELFGVFGEEVYVFEVHPPPERIIISEGPSVLLYGQGRRLNTTETLDVVTYEADYILSLTGSMSYNLTSWPKYWSFEDITPEPYVKHVDANNWINFTGEENVEYNVFWKANAIYQPVIWKDDSFKIDEWQVSLSVHWEQPPSVSTDGDILNMTGAFQEGIREGYHITREVANISTDEYPYVIVRWKSTGTVAGVAVKYDDAIMQVLKPDVKWHYAQYSVGWEVNVIKLPEGKTIKSVTLALDDYPSWTDVNGQHSVYYDYIMFTSVSSPKF